LQHTIFFLIQKHLNWMFFCEIEYRQGVLNSGTKYSINCDFNYKSSEVES
jgi:hypothetical protein